MVVMVMPIDLAVAMRLDGHIVTALFLLELDGRDFLLFTLLGTQLGGERKTLLLVFGDLCDLDVVHLAIGIEVHVVVVIVLGIELLLEIFRALRLGRQIGHRLQVQTFGGVLHDRRDVGGFVIGSTTGQHQRGAGEDRC